MNGSVSSSSFPPGNFSFFYIKRDFGFVRVVQMMWRLNFLVLLLMLVQGSTYVYAHTHAHVTPTPVTSACRWWFEVTVDVRERERWVVACTSCNRGT